MAGILIVTRDKEVFHIIRTCFPSEKVVEKVSSRDAALATLPRKRYDFIFIDLSLLADPRTGNGYKAALQQFWLVYPTVEIVVMSSQEMIREAVKAVKEGASNYLTYPLSVDEVKYVTESINESKLFQSELDYLRDKFWREDSQKLILTNSPAMQEVFEKIRSVAPAMSTVLLVGETGTGKSVLAQIIHKHSQRSDCQFISVHCGAIPDTLLESELFGHEKGAFTGAIRRKLGKFEIAKDGTIFLDEIATITASAQIKLLQILQEKIFQRVGGEETIEANVRVIAATNMDLEEMCAAGLFRKDLYYRINVFPIHIPPLRERKEDIPLSVETFIKKLNQFHNKDIHGIEPQVLSVLTNYSWPGNIRELENLIERAYILEHTSILTKNGFPVELFQAHPQLQTKFIPDLSLSLAEMRRVGIEQLELDYLSDLLKKNKGRINKTAISAEISTRQLHKLMKKYNLRKEDFK